MQKKRMNNSLLRNILITIFFFNFTSLALTEIIIYKGCKNKNDGFEKNIYTLDIKKSLMKRDFIYNNKTYKKYRLVDINTKKNNSISRFIYSEGDKFFTEKIGYPQFYTQLLFEKNNPIIKIRTVINNEPAESNLSKCNKIEIFDTKS